MKVGIVSRKSCKKLVSEIKGYGYEAVHLSAKNMVDFVKSMGNESSGCDVVVIAETQAFFERAGLDQMLRRAFWQNEILSAVSVNSTGWIYDAGFEKNKQGEFLPRQVDRNIIHPGNLCCNLVPLNVDGISNNLVAMNSKLLRGLTLAPKWLETEADLVVVPDVQVVARGKSLPVITATREESVCFNPELDAYNKEFSLK